MAKHITDEEVPQSVIKEFLQPFLDIVAHTNNKSLREKIYQYVFEYIKDKHESENLFPQLELPNYGNLVFRLAK